MSESYYFVPAEFASSPTRIRMCRFVLVEIQKGAKPGTKGYSGSLSYKTYGDNIRFYLMFSLPLARRALRLAAECACVAFVDFIWLLTSCSHYASNSFSYFILTG